MSNNSRFIACVVGALLLPSAVCATTVDELADKNRRLHEMDFDIQLAKKTAELASVQNANKPSVAASPAPAAATSPQPGRRAQGTGTQNGFDLLSLSGPVEDPVAEGAINGNLVSLRKRHKSPSGWSLVAVTGDGVVVADPKGRQHTLELSRPRSMNETPSQSAAVPPLPSVAPLPPLTSVPTQPFTGH